MKACFKPFNHTAFFYWNCTACASYIFKVSLKVFISHSSIFLKSSEFRNLSNMTRKEREKKDPYENKDFL